MSTTILSRLPTIRVPFFRILYSTTYTVLYIITLCFLAVTPASMVWQATEQRAYQYSLMISITCALVAIIALFIYLSRLYTNRSVLASVGKAYLPIEDGEVGKSVRRLIVKQLERSALIAWETRPRELASERGIDNADVAQSPKVDGKDGPDRIYGRLLTIDPAHPPWGHVKHAGWSASSEFTPDQHSYLQFEPVILELPNLVEARAVSLAPPDSAMSDLDNDDNNNNIADPVVVEALRRPANMGLRDYLTQLSYLGLISMPEVGHRFLADYERARFSGQPISEEDFRQLMENFSLLMSSLTELHPLVVQEIRLQATEEKSSVRSIPFSGSGQRYSRTSAAYSQADTSDSGKRNYVTAPTRLSSVATPRLNHDGLDTESFHSVVRRTPQTLASENRADAESWQSSTDSSSLMSFPSDVGSVIVRHSPPSRKVG